MKPSIAAMFGFAAMLGASTGHAQQIDPHILYESKCGTCHVPHAGEFVSQSVVVDGTELIGNSTQIPVRTFLQTGHGRLSNSEIDTMMEHLETIQDSGQLFIRKCTICHGRAVVLSELNLIMKEGEPWGRYTGRKIEVFLQDHGRLTQDEIPIIMGAFVRQLVPADGVEN